MDVGGLTIPVRRLVTSMGPRHEPLTYWVTTGNEATISGWRRRMIAVRYGLQRRVPDGLLVRVSSIDRSDTQAFEMQQRFLADMVQAMAAADREIVVGTVSLPAAASG